MAKFIALSSHETGVGFDSVGCLHLFSSSYTRCLYGHVLIKVIDLRKLSSMIIISDKLYHRRVSLQSLFMINWRLIFLLRQKRKTCLLFLQLMRRFVGFLVWNHANSSLGFSRFFIADYFHLHSFSHETFYPIEICSWLESSVFSATLQTKLVETAADISRMWTNAFNHTYSYKSQVELTRSKMENFNKYQSYIQHRQLGEIHHLIVVSIWKPSKPKYHGRVATCVRSPHAFRC